MTVDKKRIEFIDLAKGICILLVVLLHVVPQLSEKFAYLSCLRMPLYFCLSGLFYKNYGSIKNFTIKKVNNILIPFISWYIIGYGIYYIGRLFMPSGEESTFHFNDIIFQNEIFNLPIWFLLCLFWSNLLFNLITSFARKWYYQLSGVMVVAIIGLIWSKSGVFNFLYLGSSMTCLPFFYMGYALKQTTLLYPESDKKKDFVIMCACLIISSVLAFMPDSVPRLNYYKNEILAGNIISIYFCSIFFVIGVLLLCKFIKNIPFISWLGRYSIIVLVSHMWLRDVISTLFNKAIGLNISELYRDLIVFAIIIISMSVVIPLFKKYLPYITAQKGLLKTSSNNMVALLNK